MNGKLTAALAAGAVAIATLAAGPALAQQGTNAITGFGQGGRAPEKKPQYVPGAKPQEKMFPLGATWTAVSLNGKPFSGNDRPTFIIDSQYRARGYGGCNTFTATAFPLREQNLAVGPLALTKKSCDKALAATEQSFLVALRTSGAWDLVGSQLVIRTQSGELKFDRAL
ncbi:heat-shock protein [Methylobacterium sp. Leaf456]|uniref:META domain-containing protein n=1 Tax=Methylobacterium sp. Leaf456 TaxID=1736382 RepID=UPI0006FF9428|nr:META domain-containing protein [Methylobacterium sp. Leaf456]KQT46684.1 heat-shock protein [Methylobacterium sp. Leaf456]